MFLDLHHEVVYVDELAAHGQGLEGSLRQDLLEPVVVLDEVGQGCLRGEGGGGRVNTKHQLVTHTGDSDLQNGSPVLEVSEGLHHFLVQALDG